MNSIDVHRLVLRFPWFGKQLCTIQDQKRTNFKSSTVSGITFSEKWGPKSAGVGWRPVHSGQGSPQHDLLARTQPAHNDGLITSERLQLRVVCGDGV